MPININEVFSSLAQIDWNVLVKTYGNNHSSLIGTLTNWWNNLYTDNSSIESGPKINFGNNQRGQCDALFCNGNNPVGVLEVEGTRFVYTIEKMKLFLNSQEEIYQSIEFGLLLLYNGKGRSYNRTFEQNNPITYFNDLRNDNRKPIILVVINKNFSNDVSPVRRINEYYKGTVNAIKGYLILTDYQEERIFFQ